MDEADSLSAELSDLDVKLASNESLHEAMDRLLELAPIHPEEVWAFARRYMCSRNPDTRELSGSWILTGLLERAWETFFPLLEKDIRNGDVFLQDTLGLIWPCGRPTMEANREKWEPLIDSPTLRGRSPKLLEFLRQLHRFNGPWEPAGPLDAHSRRPPCGDTPLHVALIQGDVEAAKELISSGANVNARGEDDFSPLHWAVRLDVDTVRALLAAGANPAAVNLFGDTPADRARLENRFDVLAILCSLA